MTTLILASTSPFRKAILEKLALPFSTQSPDVDETPLENELPEQLVERLSILKAKAVADNISEGLVIGSDQVAVIDGTILGKPGNHDKAMEQLKQASGKTVTFLTGLCLYNAARDNYQVDVVPFKVVFRELSETQIDTYLKKEQPYNCAGSFKSEALGITLFEKLVGDDPNTLIGLPLIRLVKMLEDEGVTVI